MEQRNRRGIGILFILGAALGFAGMNLFVNLAGELPTMQKVFFRNLFAAAIVFFVLLFSKDPREKLRPLAASPLCFRLYRRNFKLLRDRSDRQHFGRFDLEQALPLFCGSLFNLSFKREAEAL